jgi:hypothetical protein
MKRILDKFLYGSTLAAVLFCTVFALAEDAKQETVEEATPTISAEFVDPAFDRYIDIALLGLAWEAQNGAALTDAALQLAEGERVLFRSHKTFTSKSVFEKALAVAADQKDKTTLERLAKIAKASGDTEFVVKVSQTTKLSAASRAVGSDIEKITDPASEGSLAYVQYLSELIGRIRVTGDKAALDDIEKTVKELKPSNETISQGEIDSLKKLLGESRAAIGEVSAEEQESGYALEKLAGESRWGPPPVHSIHFQHPQVVCVPLPPPPPQHSHVHFLPPPPPNPHWHHPHYYQGGHHPGGHPVPSHSGYPGGHPGPQHGGQHGGHNH